MDRETTLKDRRRANATKKRERRANDPEAAAHEIELQRLAPQHAREHNPAQAEARRLHDRTHKADQRRQFAPQADAHRLRDRTRKADERQHGAPQAETHTQRRRERRRIQQTHRQNALNIEYDVRPYDPSMGKPCQHCGANLLDAEVRATGGRARITPCCGSGKVSCFADR
jgi:hypothetical protein